MEKNSAGRFLFQGSCGTMRMVFKSGRIPCRTRRIDHIIQCNSERGGLS